MPLLVLGAAVVAATTPLIAQDSSGRQAVTLSGFIALFGIAVLNGVVLVMYINQLRVGGREIQDAVREGAQSDSGPY